MERKGICHDEGISSTRFGLLERLLRSSKARISWRKHTGCSSGSQKRNIPCFGLIPKSLSIRGLMPVAEAFDGQIQGHLGRSAAGKPRTHLV